MFTVEVKQCSVKGQCTSVNSHISISDEASFPVGPKWILMNFPCREMILSDARTKINIIILIM